MFAVCVPNLHLNTLIIINNYSKLCAHLLSSYEYLVNLSISVVVLRAYALNKCIAMSQGLPRDLNANSKVEKKKIDLHWPGIEPGPPAWQARILPLNHQCLAISVDNLFWLYQKLLYNSNYLHGSILNKSARGIILVNLPCVWRGRGRQRLHPKGAPFSDFWSVKG